MKSITIHFKGEGGTWERNLSDEKLNSYINDNEDMLRDYPGLKGSQELVLEIPKVGGEPHESLWWHSHTATHEDGRNFTEGRIANDSIYHYPLYQNGQLTIIVDGVVIFSSAELYLNDDMVELFDQTSFSFFFGTPFLLKHRNYDKYTNRCYPGLRELVGPGGGAEEDFAKALRKELPRGNMGRDKYRDSHYTGSMLSCWEDIGMFGHLTQKVDHEKVATRFLEWVTEFYGTWYPGPYGDLVFDPGRPYHLYEYVEGQSARPFNREHEYRVDSIDELDQPHTGAHFYDGTIQLSLGRNRKPGVGLDTFGRIHGGIVSYRSTQETRDWIGKRVNQFPGGTRPDSVTAGGNTGDDPEHKFRNKRAFAAALAMPSLFARNALHNLVHTFANSVPNKYGFKTQGPPHSDRACGWPLGELIAHYIVNDDEFAWKEIEAILTMLHENRENGLLADWYPETAPGLVNRENQRSKWPNTKGSLSACWQAATIGEHARMFAEYFGHEGGTLKDTVNMAIWAHSESMKIAHACFDKGTIQLYENIWVDKDGGHVDKHGYLTNLGTRLWVDNHASEKDFAKLLFQALQQRGGQYSWPDDNPSTWYWHAKSRLEQEKKA